MSRAPERLWRNGGAGRALRTLAASTPPYDVDAGLARLTAAIGAAAVAGTAGSAAAGSAAGAPGAAVATKAAAIGSKAAAATAKLTLGAKLAITTAVLASGVGTATVLVPGDDEHASRHGATTTPSSLPSVSSRPSASPGDAVPRYAAPNAVDAPASSADAPGEASPASASTAPEAPATGAGPSASTTALRSGDRPGRAEDDRVDAAPRPSAVPLPSSAAAAPVALGPEMEHLVALRRTHDPAWALSRAEEGHATFPHGLFWQEREVIAITSLARLGRADEARTRARTFITKHPKSPGVEELRKLLGK